MLPTKTGTDGALVVPLTSRWNQNGIAAPSQTKQPNVMEALNTAPIHDIPIYPKMETSPLANPTSTRPTVINPMDFMRGNPYE